MLLQLLLFLLAFGQTDAAAQQFYVNAANDTVWCKIEKEYIDALKIERGGKKEKVAATEVKAYKARGIDMITKKIIRDNDTVCFFAPAGRVNMVYQFNNPKLKVVSNNSTSFYELTTYGSYNKHGRDVKTEWFLDDDEKGVTQLPYLGVFAAKATKDKALTILKTYFRSNQHLMDLLDSPDLKLNNNTIRHLASEYFGRELAH